MSGQWNADERVASRQPARRKGLLVPLIAATLALAGLIALGTWQIERKAWKDALIEMLAQRLAAPPSDLPHRERWSRLDPAADEFRRVKFSADLVPGEMARLYAGGTAMRPDVSGPGLFVFAPARVAEGGIVVLDRGFVPEAQQALIGATGEASGPSEIVGVLRWPEQPGTFAARDDPGHNLWFTRDHRAMVQAKGWDHFGEIAPFYVAVEAPKPPGGLPRPGPLRPVLRNEHLQYALTWFGLAAVLVIAFPLWVRSRRREANSE